MLQSSGVQVAGWYHTGNVKEPTVYFAEMFRRFPSLDGVTADDGYELFVGRYAAIKEDPGLVEKGIGIGKAVAEAVHAVRPGAFVSASSTELPDRAPSASPASGTVRSTTSSPKSTTRSKTPPPSSRLGS